MAWIHVLAGGEVASPAIYATETAINAVLGAGDAKIERTTVPDIVEPGVWYHSADDDFFLYPPSTNTGPADAAITQQLTRLHAAYLDYHLRTRKDGWRSLGDAEASGHALLATDRWAYSQIALGDLLVRNEWASGRTQAVRDAAIDQIVEWIGRQGYTWYSVMLGNSGVRNRWRAVGVAGSSLIYTDLLVGTGSTAGDTRTPDGTWNPTTATIHADFDPEVPDLRTS